jgi:hypothetical protein
MIVVVDNQRTIDASNERTRRATSMLKHLFCESCSWLPLRNVITAIRFGSKRILAAYRVKMRKELAQRAI